MATVEPIRDPRQIAAMQRQLRKAGSRDEILFMVGINTGFRMGDILKLQVKDVRAKSHIVVIEEKTGKQKKALINPMLRRLLDDYTADMNDEDYLFPSRKTALGKKAGGGQRPITRSHAYKIITDAAGKLGIKGVGTHTCRKSFGYHFYQSTKDIALLMELFNHSSESVTKRYIGLNQDMLDKSVENFFLGEVGQKD